MKKQNKNLLIALLIVINIAFVAFHILHCYAYSMLQKSFMEQSELIWRIILKEN
jgi:hypothetical protein